MSTVVEDFDTTSRAVLASLRKQALVVDAAMELLVRAAVDTTGTDAYAMVKINVDAPTWYILKRRLDDLKP